MYSWGSASKALAPGFQFGVLIWCLAPSFMLGLVSTFPQKPLPGTCGSDRVKKMAQDEPR
jgi:hypothetical protein